MNVPLHDVVVMAGKVETRIEVPTLPSSTAGAARRQPMRRRSSTFALFLRMPERHCVEPVRNHDWVRRLRGAVGVELFLEHVIDQRVDPKWRARRSPYAFTVIEPETSRALDVSLDLTAAHLERFVRAALEQAT